MSSRKELLLRSRDLDEDEAGEAGVEVESVWARVECALTLELEPLSSTVADDIASSTNGVSGTIVVVDALLERETGDVEMLSRAGGGDNMVTGALSETALVAKLSSSSFSSTISSGIHSFGVGSAAGVAKGMSSDKKRLRDSGDMSRDRTDLTLPVGVALLRVSYPLLSSGCE